MNWTLLGFILYLIAVMIVGFITYRKNESEYDFFLGGRRLNPWVIAISERASGESAWLLLGLPGAAYALGLIEIWTALGCLLGILFYWNAVAPGLRKMSGEMNSITLPEFFAEKFTKGKKAIRILSTLIILFFFTFYLAAQFNGAGKVLNVTFGIEPFYGMLIGTAVIIVYTMMGGFFAVAWTDFIQGTIMFGTLVILPVAGLIEVYSSDLTLESAFAKSGESFLSLTGGKTGWAGIAAIIGGLSWALGYMGQPHLLTRFMAIKDPGKIRISRRIAYVWAIPAFTGAIITGFCGLALYGKGYFPDAEYIMPHLASTLIPSWLAGIFISGAVAAMMSTADSQLLVASSAVAEDLFHRTLGVRFSRGGMLRFSRGVTLVVGIVAFGIAVTSQKMIFAMVSYAWSGLGASFGPALLLILWWKKTTWQGVLAGMVTGTASTILWTEIPFLDAALSVRAVSFFLALVSVLLVSWKTQPDTESIL